MFCVVALLLAATAGCSDDSSNQDSNKAPYDKAAANAALTKDDTGQLQKPSNAENNQSAAYEATRNTGIKKRDQFYAMGTLIEVITYDVDKAVHVKAIQEIEAMFLALSRRWQPWPQPNQADGELAIINKNLLAGLAAPSNEQFNRIMLEATELSVASRGFFNPAVGKLVQLWGFDGKSDKPLISAPLAEDINALVGAKHGMHLLRFTANSVSSVEPLALDFGAFLKGYAVDRAVDILRDYSITNGLVEAGGDLRAIGQAGDRPWRIGIRNPRQSGVLAVIEMQSGESIFTSGDYERFFEVEVDDLAKPINQNESDSQARVFAKKKQRFHHILDPRTGYPAANTVSVTVITKNGALADAAATALFVAGPSQWYKVAASMGVKHVLLMDVDGNVYLNPAMAGRVQFKSTPKGAITLSKPLR